ncbi:L-aminoadipate-semialdehyde dehydrogenase-phosphopantetheinyl transferase [Dendroctonus ponderosae]|nr:L-aminoadipate-semialdehyde dehydrogenase-phosphopantetheinyl transferase [Dendroctonus ponderosae]XP_048523983.1 L-aminoadipate-semialdehyde dehydrogenase-phosphopantetheinyl transferase [Dendroctonus ponderosae]
MAPSSVRWYFNLSKWSPTYQELLLATACIQPEEKLRLGKFVFKKDFKSSLIGRLMMRKFVSESCGLNYAALRFSRQEKGRPGLETPEKVSFNVSHHGDYTVLAGELGDALLGVDVMKLEYTGGKPLSEFFRIMNRNFSTLEWRQIYAPKSPAEQLNMFCRLWALKESYTKAIGLGITMKLSEISFKISSPLTKERFTCDSKLFVDGEELTGWAFHEVLLDDFHCVAVATDRPVDEVQFKELDFSELVRNAEAFQPPDESYCLDYFKKAEKPC